MAKKIGVLELRTFRKEALDAHNKHRRNHDCMGMRISEILNSSAQKWAEHLAKSGEFKNSTGQRDYGENVGMYYSSGGTDFSGSAATENWYKGVEKYNFKKPGFQKDAGNFTQVVWKGSSEFGIGKAITKENKVIYVAHYKPPGNVAGRFEGNVFPPKSGVKVTTSTTSEPSSTGAKGGRRDLNSSSSSDSSSDDEGKGRSEKKYEDKDIKTKVRRSEMKKFREDALEAHNDIRRHHKVASLELCSELCKSATKWAKHLAKSGKFEVSPREDFGENLGMHYSSVTTEFSGRDAADNWYADMGKYDFKKPGYQKGSGQFTQMVWKGSKEIGVGKAITKEGKVIYVGHYRPAGNVMDHFEENVFARDDNYVPPTKEGGARKVRLTSGDDEDARRRQELDDTVKRTSQMKLLSADTRPKDLKDFRRDALLKHNDYRRLHRVNVLEDSADLTLRAQKFAAYLAEKDLFENSTEDDVGENISMHYNSASTTLSGEEATEMFYKQKEKYDFKKPGYTKGAGHFTQLVWKETKEMGIGKAITKEGKVIIVAFYKPPGNVRRQYEENVHAPRK